MGDFPFYQQRASPILTPYSPESLPPIAGFTGPLGNAASAAWLSNNLALFYPFRLTTWETAYQLLFYVGATSSGNIDVGIYDNQLHRIVSAGTTAMSATVNTVQEINITDTVLSPGDYYLAGACSTTGGTCFRRAGAADELMLTYSPIYEQASALPLPDPASPVVTTQGTPPLVVIGIQFRSVF